MDTSEQYIKRCDCEEIQGLRPLDKEAETWYLSPRTNVDFGGDSASGSLKSEVTQAEDARFIQGKVYTFGDYEAFGKDYWCDGYESIDPNLFIWLPRQDELQAMFGGYGVRQLTQCFFRFACSINCDELEYTQIFTSMEQLWLAFVMKEKFKKKWNGTEWVSE